MVQITVDGEGDEGVLKKVGPKTPRPKEGQSRVQVLENGGRFRCPVDLGAGKGHSTCDTKERTVSKSGGFFTLNHPKIGLKKRSVSVSSFCTGMDVSD